MKHQTSPLTAAPQDGAHASSQAAHIAPTNDRIAREPERRRITGLSRATWYRLEKKGLVPPRIQIGPHAVGWVRSSLQNFIHEGLSPKQIASEKKDPTAIVELTGKAGA